MYHVGGNGPWIEKVDGVVEGGIEPPEKCSVEQIHMVCARWPRRSRGLQLTLRSCHGMLNGTLPWLLEIVRLSTLSSNVTAFRLSDRADEL